MLSPLRSLLVLLGSLSLLACDYGDGDASSNGRYPGYGDGGAYAASCGSLEGAFIDSDKTLDAEPGDGAGVFIEYEAGGLYRVTTACDTLQGVCTWDIVVTLLDGATLESLTPVALEGDDTLVFGETDSVRLLAYTSDNFDGFTLQTQPGAAIRVDALLDGDCANRYMFWFGDGALHNGSPSNPIDLTPSEP